MKNSIFISFSAKIFFIAAAIFLAPSQAWATWSHVNCRDPKGYTNIPWTYTVTGPAFSNWLNTAATNVPIDVATVSLSSKEWGYNVACSITNAIFSQRNVRWILPTNYGGYYQVDGFNDIKFKVKLVYYDDPMANFSSGGAWLGDARSQKTVVSPDNTMPTVNFGACTAYVLISASASYMCTFAGNNGLNTDYTANYLQKTWTYTLMAYKTGLSPSVTAFPTAANTLPVLYLDGDFIHLDGNQVSAPGRPNLYCIGCTSTGGTKPEITVPADCNITGATNQEIPLNPPTVNWNNFSVGLSSTLKVNPEWTPFSVKFSCKRAPTTARFYAKDATSGANTAEPAGKLLNSFGGNVGVQVFYKNVNNATCTGTTAPTGGVAVPLNNVTTVTIPGGTGILQPTQYFCARYYTTAESSTALTLGSVASTMSYTFQYE